MQIERVVVGVIDIGERLRSVNPDKVSQIAESIKSLGLINPITLYSATDYTVSLVAGAHRLAAVKQLGWEEIDAIVIGGSEIEAQLTEIDENLCRHELSPSEEAEHLAKRQELWEARAAQRVSAQVEPKLSARGRENEGRPEGFATETAKATGKSKASINRAIKRAHDVCQEARDLIRNTKLDTGAMLDRLAKMDQPEDQLAYVQDQLDVIRDKERRDALMAEREQRDAEARRLREESRMACCNFLCTMMNGRDWARLIDMIDRAGGTISAKQLRDWQSP